MYCVWHLPALVALCVFACGIAHAQTRGLGVKARTKQGKEVSLYSEYRALVIGVGEYEYCPKLPRAVDDAREVAAALGMLGFDVTLAVNPNAAELRALFKRLVFEIGADESDAVLVYFAGHGETVALADGSLLGHVLPVDCPLKTENAVVFDDKAVSMKEIEDAALKIPAKHVLMIFDSCFSGSIFSMTRAMPKDISEKIGRPVRQFITAGGEDEEVPDRSIFKEVFLEAMQGEADLNGDGYVTGTELGMHLDSSVVNYSNGAQHPQYGKIRNPRLDKGDFVFVMRDAEEEARLKAAEEARLRAEEEARLKAEEEARLKAEEEARLRELERRTHRPSENSKDEPVVPVKVPGAVASGAGSSEKAPWWIWAGVAAGVVALGGAGYLLYDAVEAPKGNEKQTVTVTW